MTGFDAASNDLAELIGARWRDHAFMRGWVYDLNFVKSQGAPNFDDFQRVLRQRARNGFFLLGTDGGRVTDPTVSGNPVGDGVAVIRVPVRVWRNDSGAALFSDVWAGDTLYRLSNVVLIRSGNESQADRAEFLTTVPERTKDAAFEIARDVERATATTIREISSSPIVLVAVAGVAALVAIRALG